MAGELNKAVPILAALDISATASFYEDKLGFETVTRLDDYLIMQRDSIEMHFWNCDDEYIAESTACYIHVSNIADLYQEYQGVGIIVRELQKQPYGVYDFVIHDADGNQITFAEAASEE